MAVFSFPIFPTFHHIISHQKLFYTHKLPTFFQTPNFLQTSNFFQELNTPSASVLMMFTIYGSNVAVDFDIIEHAVATNHPHIFKTLYYGNLVYFLFHQTCFIQCIHSVSLYIDVMLQRTEILHCNKSPTYFRNSILREFGLFFVPPKMFHLVYSQCFTMYRSNVAVNETFHCNKKKLTYFGNPLVRVTDKVYPLPLDIYCIPIRYTCAYTDVSYTR